MSHRVQGYVRTHHVALLALFVALGGTSYAAVKLPAGSVGSKQLARNSVTSAKVRNGTLLRRDFKQGQLVAGANGAPGAKGEPGATGPQGPAGAKGDTGAKGATGATGPQGEIGPEGAEGPQGIQGVEGPEGPEGPKGDTGTVDTSNFYDKAASDGRFLGLGAKASDANQLDGIDSSGFIQGSGRTLFNRAAFTITSGSTVLTVPGWGAFNAYGNASANSHSHAFYNSSGEALSVFRDTGAADPTWSIVQNGDGVSTPTVTTGADLVKWLIVRQVGASTQVLNATVATADQGDVFEVTVQALVQP